MDPEAVAGVERVAHGGAADLRLLDFSANTNPERPSGVVGIYESAFGAASEYPADDYCEFRTAAGAYVGCEPRDVVPTSGGLAAIRLALNVVVEAGESVLVPTPSFGEYDREIRLQGGLPEAVPYDELLDADPSDHAAAIVCNPNNPTGDAYPTDELVRFAERCRRAGTTLVADEAFLDFTNRPSLAGEPGVVVARSLTKMFGLPGLRAGFAVATGDLRDRLETARLTWTLSTPCADVGAYCMKQTEFVERTRRRVESERERMRAALSTRFDVHPSDAPFLLLDVSPHDASTVIDAARERDIVLRDATTFPGLDSHVRVAVKRPSQNDCLLDALSDV
ncbi:aminotransferase class I/II-fold pyridoxal phosphate-dependent enzyme [Salinirarus marinus]|uniref:aminotransferase class I/II-fold pyridoxal phosphate-dependent enzyme n=1 Tax=Salinirarus marinus TaxID=3068310 RepID=UPI003C6CA157